MKVYKLTDRNDQTTKNTQWGENITHHIIGDLIQCKNGIHSYYDPLIAAMLNPIHGCFDLTTAHLWECDASDEYIDDHGLKNCHRSLTAIKRIELPEVTITQRVAFGVLCALEVYRDKKFQTWADNWLSGKNRARKAADAARAATWAAAESAAMAATWAAAAAAARAAAARAADDATWAAAAAAAATWAAAAAERAAESDNKIDLISLAKKAMEYK
jgi:hypothetical protein